MNVKLINEKVRQSDWRDGIDVYDLNQNSAAKMGMTTLGLSEPEKTGGKLLAKKGVDMATGTDFSRKLLAPRDWFYSDLFR